MAQKWQNGIWFNKDEGYSKMHKVDGENACLVNLAELDYPDLDFKRGEGSKGKWTFGKFDETPAEIKAITGQTHYNIQPSYWHGKWNQFGVLSEDGKDIVLIGFFVDISKIRWLSNQALNQILDVRDDVKIRST